MAGVGVDIDLSVVGLESIGRLARVLPGWLKVDAVELTLEALHEDAVLRLEDDDTAPDGSAWKEWSEAYARTRSGTDKLLHSSGDLAKSLRVDDVSGGFDLVSTSPYARAHQEGVPERNLEARPYVGVSAEVMIAIDDILEIDFEREANRVGG